MDDLKNLLEQCGFTKCNIDDIIKTYNEIYEAERKFYKYDSTRAIEKLLNKIKSRNIWSFTKFSVKLCECATIKHNNNFLIIVERLFDAIITVNNNVNEYPTQYLRRRKYEMHIFNYYTQNVTFEPIVEPLINQLKFSYAYFYVFSGEDLVGNLVTVDVRNECEKTENIMSSIKNRQCVKNTMSLFEQLYNSSNKIAHNCLGNERVLLQLSDFL